MNNYTIFVSSSDAYADLWPVFFDLFKIYWPEFEGEIYLNTEEKTFTHPGLNIISTKVGKQQSFGITFRKGLDQINGDHILLIMIDYIFMGKVSNDKIEEYFYYFVQKGLDSLCLVDLGFPNTKDSEHPELKLVYPPAPRIMFSYQIAFWKKSMLYQMSLPHENPWTSEWYGTLRAEKMNIKLASVYNEAFNPIPYDLAGCLHKGKWLKNAVEFLHSINYQLNFKSRGYYQETPQTIKSRIKVRWMLIMDGLKGSYWDLLKR